MWICLYCVENDINLLFDLWQMAAILAFTDNAMFKVISDHTTIHMLDRAYLKAP